MASILARWAVCCVVPVVLFGVGTPAVAKPINSRFSPPGISIADPYQGYCYGEVGPLEGVFVQLELTIFDPNMNWRNSAPAPGWEFAYGYVYSPLDLTGQWTCQAHLWVDGNYLGSYISNFAIWLLVVDVTINAFIPDNHYPVWVPFLGAVATASGDDRGFSRHGSTRSYWIAELLQPNTYDALEMYYQRDVGLSQLYDVGYACPGTTSIDGSNRIHAFALSDWTYGCPWKLTWNQPSTDTLSCYAWKLNRDNLRYQCTGDAATPLVWEDGTPGMTYDLTLTLTYGTDASISYSLEGAHDGFPDYEMYIGDQRIYEHHYPDFGQNINSLWPPMEFPVNRSGWVW